MELSPAQTHTLVASSALMNAIQSFASAEVSGRSPAAPIPDVSNVVVTLGTAVAGGPPTYSFAVQLRLDDGGDALGGGGVEEGTGGGSGSDYNGDGNSWLIDITPLPPASTSTTPSSITPSTTTLRLSDVDWSADSPLLLAGLPGAGPDASPSAHTLRVQLVARLPGGFRLQLAGATQDVYVRTPATHALARHMLPKRVRDFSRVLVSPMPGVLVSLIVKPGDTVEEGQEVAVVEAMKMQNVLRAPKRGRVKAAHAKPGDTLAVDQTIVEFE